MEKLKAILKQIFFLPPMPTFVLALFGYGLILSVAIFDIQIPSLQYCAYLASAYALAITITGFPHIRTAAESVKRFVAGLPPIQKIHSTATGEKFLTDVRYRTDIFLYLGLFINLLYIVIKLISGIYYRSMWFISLAIYYALLALMRFLLVRRVYVQSEMLEWRRYRMCGIILLLMNQALAGIVIFMVRHDRGFDYPGLLIYAMALYAFYAVITAVVSLIKMRRHNSPVLSAAKAIRLVAALVSILSLETAMLAHFGSGDDTMFRRVMTGATGGGVCTIVIIMAVFMIIRANKNMKKNTLTQPRRNNSG